MAAADPISPELRRLSIRLPRPLWIGLAAFVLMVVAVGLRVGEPIYRQQAAIAESPPPVDRGEGTSGESRVLD